MKLITFLYKGEKRTGIVSNDSTVCDITEQYGDMNSLIISGKIPEITEDSERIPLDEVKLLAPIIEPRQDIICLGINYTEHAKESARFKKETFETNRLYPVYFGKRVNEALCDNGTIHIKSELDESVDYESELAFIIGKDAENVKAEDAEQYIFGYTIINDVSARALQTSHKQWYFGKSLDGFTPMGPCIVTADEISFPPALDVKSYVNGELRQNSNTSKLIFGIPYIISELSSGMKLKAGTIISTGTPAGAGMGFTPPEFLKSGDKVVCEVEKIGTLTTYFE